MNQAGATIIRIINRVEDGLLVFILSSMILLSIFQVLARNFFSEGVVWIDPMLRMLVLWVGLAGAVVATRTDNHIRIDVLIKYMPERYQAYVHRLVYLFTSSVCLLISWHAYRFVYSEYEYGSVAFASIPIWVTALILPLGFFFIAARYLLLFINPGLSSSSREKPAPCLEQPAHQAVHIPEHCSDQPLANKMKKESDS
jgi:TRAP-type C4-dicarboxylate transport system permease small subunit